GTAHEMSNPKQPGASGSTSPSSSHEQGNSSEDTDPLRTPPCHTGALPSPEELPRKHLTQNNLAQMAPHLPVVPTSRTTHPKIQNQLKRQSQNAPQMTLPRPSDRRIQSGSTPPTGPSPNDEQMSQDVACHPH